MPEADLLCCTATMQPPTNQSEKSCQNSSLHLALQFSIFSSNTMTRSTAPFDLRIRISPERKHARQVA